MKKSLAIILALTTLLVCLSIGTTAFSASAADSGEEFTSVLFAPDSPKVTTTGVSSVSSTGVVDVDADSTTGFPGGTAYQAVIPTTSATAGVAVTTGNSNFTVAYDSSLTYRLEGWLYVSDATIASILRLDVSMANGWDSNGLIFTKAVTSTDWNTTNSSGTIETGWNYFSLSVSSARGTPTYLDSFRFFVQGRSTSLGEVTIRLASLKLVATSKNGLESASLINEGSKSTDDIVSLATTTSTNSVSVISTDAYDSTHPYNGTATDAYQTTVNAGVCGYLLEVPDAYKISFEDLLTTYISHYYMAVNIYFDGTPSNFVIRLLGSNKAMGERYIQYYECQINSTSHKKYFRLHAGWNQLLIPLSDFGISDSDAKQATKYGFDTFEYISFHDHSNSGVTFALAECEIVALNHAPRTVEAVAATCSAEGHTAGVECMICGEAIKATTVIAIDPDAHSSDEGVFDPDTLVTTYTCELCGEVVNTVQHGDVNKDGAIDATDVTVLQRYLCHWIQSTDIDADINGDDAINIKDLVYLVRYLQKNG